MKNDKIFVPVETSDSTEEKSYINIIERSLVLFKRLSSQKEKFLKWEGIISKRTKEVKLKDLLDKLVSYSFLF